MSPQPQFYGKGVLDCTSECSGTEDQLKDFLKFVREGFKKKIVEVSTKRGGGFGSADFPLRKI